METYSIDENFLLRATIALNENLNEVTSKIEKIQGNTIFLKSSIDNLYKRTSRRNIILMSLVGVLLVESYKQNKRLKKLESIIDDETKQEDEIEQVE